MTDTQKLAYINERKAEIGTKLEAILGEYETLWGYALEELGNSPSMHDLKLLLWNASNDFDNTELNEEDFLDTFEQDAREGEEPADDRSEKLDEDEKYL